MNLTCALIAQFAPWASHLYTLCALPLWVTLSIWLSSVSYAADPLWEGSPSPRLEVSLPEHALSGVFDSLAYEALSVTAPDADNALVRVGVAPVLVEEGDPLLADALTSALRAVVGAQPHAVALPQEAVSNLWRTWRAQSQRHQLPLTLTRAISLGRTMGARYLIISRLRAEGGAHLFETQTISMKQLRVIHKGSQRITGQALKSFKDQVFRSESRFNALWRSAALPGWGQLYQGRRAAAIGYSAAAAIFTIGALASTFEGLAAQATYLEGDAGGVPYRTKANQAFSRANYLWAGLGAVWVTSLIDSFIMGKEARTLRLQFDPNGGVGLAGEF